MATEIVLVDYLLEDLDQVEMALQDAGADVIVSSSPDDIATARGVVLAGHAMFEDAIEQLRAMGLDTCLKSYIAADRHLLAIGTGMQMLFSVGREVEPGKIGDHVVDGLKIRPGSTPPLPEEDWLGKVYELPHEGFARVDYDDRCPTPLLDGIPDGESYYYSHSFAVPTGPWVQAWSNYSTIFPAVVDFGRTTYGVQFHPELSGEAGIRLLKRFVEIVAQSPEGEKLVFPQGPPKPL